MIIGSMAGSGFALTIIVNSVTDDDSINKVVSNRVNVSFLITRYIHLDAV